jgi:hypothetical protein
LTPKAGRLSFYFNWFISHENSFVDQQPDLPREIQEPERSDGSLSDVIQCNSVV